MTATEQMASDRTALDLLLHRSSSAQFGTPGPTKQDIDQMIAASVTAADHGRIRPWRFVVMRGEGRERLASAMEEQLLASNSAATPADREKARQKALRAPVVIALLCKPKVGHKVPISEQSHAVAAAGAHLMLAANALGYGASWKTGDLVYQPVLRSLLGLEDQDSIIGLFYIGTDASNARLPRATIDNVVEHWAA